MNRGIVATSTLVLFGLACSLTGPTPPESGNAATAIPESAPVEESASLRIVYPDNVNGIRGSNLWVIEGAAAPRQLTASGQDASPLFSDDGRLVAFRRIVEPILDVEELWVIDADGGEARELVSQDWLSAARPGEKTSVFRSEWVPGTHTLAFTIDVVYEEPGFLVDQNLYLVDADDGTITTAIPSGTPLALFYYSPDGTRIALTTSTSISLVDADGGGWREAMSFAGTGLGDGVYIPTLDWSPDGRYLRAALPADGLLQPGTILWHIPADGEPARILGELPTGSGVFHAPDLNHIAFFSRPAPDSPIREMHIAAGDGAGDGIYLTGDDISWLGWAPDSRRFAYSQDGAAYLGEIGAGPQPLFSNGTTVSELRWVSDDQVIFFSGERERWQLWLGTPGGTSTLLASPSGDMAEFDFSR
jgi:dipeptidyl aminopeptidase/acylaminoacyl peptidase